MEKSFPFNAVIVDGVPDRAYTAEDFAAERAAYVSNGVTAADALTVSPASAGGMAVEIAPGAAVIDGYTYWNTAALTLPIAAADALYPRVDLAVLRLDLTARTMMAAVKTGIPAEMPAPPACSLGDTVREIPLSEITVPVGETVIGDGHLSDRRPRADYILNRLEVEELLARYERALSDYFDGEDATRLVSAAKIVRGDGGAREVLCGDGAYRSLFDAFPGMKELCRFTESGTFTPADYPTADGLYTVVLQGAGGSGCTSSAGVCGGAGAMAVLSHLPLPETAIAVTVGKGGAAREVFSGFATDGHNGGATRFGNFSVPGGAGGLYSSAAEQAAAKACLFTAEVGTNEKGGSSYFGAGGRSFRSTAGGTGGIGAGGGNCSATGFSSGAGGDGVVIVYGVPADDAEAVE